MKYIIGALLLMLFISCEKNLDFENEETVSEPSTEIVDIGLVGLVTDQTGTHLTNVKVTIYANNKALGQVLSDTEGKFTYVIEDYNDEQIRVQSEKEGFTKSLRNAIIIDKKAEVILPMSDSPNPINAVIDPLNENLVSISGYTFTIDGDPLSAGIDIHNEDLSYTDFAVVDKNGYYEFFVESGMDISASVSDLCAGNISLLSGVVDMDIVIDTYTSDYDHKEIHFSGTALDCNGQLITNGTYSATFSGNTRTGKITEGFYEFDYLECRIEEGEKTFIIITNEDDQTSSENEDLIINGYETVIDPITSCGTIDQYLDIKLLDDAGSITNSARIDDPEHNYVILFSNENDIVNLKVEGSKHNINIGFQRIDDYVGLIENSEGYRSTLVEIDGELGTYKSSVGTNPVFNKLILELEPGDRVTGEISKGELSGWFLDELGEEAIHVLGSVRMKMKVD